MSTPFLSKLAEIQQTAPELFQAIWKDYFELPIHLNAMGVPYLIGHHYVGWGNHPNLKVSRQNFDDMNELYLSGQAPNAADLGARVEYTNQRLSLSGLWNLHERRAATMRERLNHLGQRITALRQKLNLH